MYILYIEIPYLKSLADIEENRKKIAVLSRTIHTTLSVSFLVTQQEWEEQLLYIYDLPYASAKYRLLEIIRDTKSILDASHSILMGYTMCVDTVARSSLEHCEFHRQRVLANIGVGVLKDGLYMGARARQDFSPCIHGTKEYRWYFVHNFKLHDRASLPSISNFLENKRCISYIQEEIQLRRAKKVSPTMPIVIRGMLATGGAENICSALRSYRTEGGENLYLHVWGDTRQSSCVVPLANSLTEAIIGGVAQYMGPRERAQFARFRALIDSLLISSDCCINKEWFINDFISMYRLILNAFCRLARAHQVAPIIYLEGAHQFGKRTWEILSHLYTAVCADYGAIVVVGCQWTPSGFSTLFDQFNLYKLKPPSLAYVQAYAEKYLSDYSQEIALSAPENISFIYYKILAAHLKEGSSRVQKETPHRISATNLIRDIVQSLTQVEYDLLLTVSVLAPHNSIVLCVLIMGELGYSEPRVRSAFERLVSIGLIRAANRCSFRIEEIKTVVENLDGHKESNTLALISDAIYRQWKVGRIPPSLALQEMIGHTRSIRQVVEIVCALMSHFSIRNDTRGLDRLLNRGIQSARVLMEPSHLKEQQALLCAGRIRLALLKNELSKAASLIENSERRTGSKLSYGYLETERARYWCITKNYQKAIASTVKAILIYQAHSFEEGIASAHTDCGYYYMMTNNLLDAKHHLQIGEQEGGVGLRTALETTRNQVLQIILHFLVGNYSKVGALASAFLQNPHYGVGEWALYMRFMRARALFELGHYAKAFDEFGKGLVTATSYGHHLAINLFNLWTGRALLFSGEPHQALIWLNKAKRKKEYHFYIAEAYTRLEKYSEASHHINIAVNCQNESVQLTLDRPNWNTGYSYTHNGHGILKHQAEAFKGYVMGKAGKNASATRILNKLIQLESVSKNDPYISVYYLLFSQILNPAERKEKFQQMLLRRSLKFMYERLQRIDDNNDRSNYLKSNYWNRQLIHQARQFHMI